MCMRKAGDGDEGGDAEKKGQKEVITSCLSGGTAADPVATSSAAMSTSSEGGSSNVYVNLDLSQIGMATCSLTVRNYSSNCDL